jgi:polyferredoxin
MTQRTLVSLLIVAVCVGTAILIEAVLAPAPRDRQIHVEAFRYGVEPSVIRVNRGDRLRLTFSSRDTAHSFFLQDYGIDAKITPGSPFVEVFDPYRAEEVGRKTQEVDLTAGHSGLLGSLATVSRHRCHVYCGPMHGFEQGDIILRPNWLLAAALGVLVALPLVGLYRVRLPTPARLTTIESVDLRATVPGLRRLLHWRGLQFYATLPVLGLFMLAILAGLVGTKMGGRNLAVMATWVVWMFIMAVMLLPLNSRIWCTICPLPVLGEYLQRWSLTGVRAAKGKRVGNWYLGLGLKWPSFLRGAWLRQLVFLCIGTLAASFAGMPRWTAIMLLGLFGAATLMGIIWERRAFCRFLCPVTSFLTVYSSAGRAMIRVSDLGVCRTCKGKDCYQGNDRGWGCPFNLYVPALKDNADCGMCTECIKSCPEDNVTLAWRRGPAEDRFKRVGQAWQALAMLTLGMAYSVIILSPWPELRDVVNVVDKGSWPRFLAYVAVLWTLTLLLIPGLYWVANRLGLRWAGHSLPSSDAFKRFAPAFVPLGLGMWVSFFATMLMVNWSFVILTAADPFNWGWNLLGLAGLPWLQLWPAAIPWMQVTLVLTGLAVSLRRGYGLWLDEVGGKARALRGFAPTGAMLSIIAGGMVVYFAHF